MSSCPFCSLAADRILISNAHSLALLDGFPISPGHTLIVPKRHISSLFETTKEEREAIFDLMDQMRGYLLEKYTPDGFNIGINDGAEAGQTVMHLHIHLIPRYAGDIKDPRGGVRWIFPDKADYWTDRK